MTKYKNAWAVAPFFMFALHGGAIFETFNLFHLAYSFLFPRFEAVSLSHEIRVSASALLSLVGASIIVSMIVGTGINNLKGSSFAWTIFAIIVSYVSYNMLPDETNHVTDLLTISIKTNSIGKFMFAFLLPYSVYFSTHQVAKRTTKTDFESKELALEERKRLNAIREAELEQEKYEATLRNKAHQEQLKSVKRYFIPENTETVAEKTQSVPNVTQSVEEPTQEQAPKKKTFFSDLNINSDLMNLNFEHEDNITATHSVANNAIGFKLHTQFVEKEQKHTHALRSNGFHIVCAYCGADHISKTKWGKYCSDECKDKYHREGGQKV